MHPSSETGRRGLPTPGGGFQAPALEGRSGCCGLSRWLALTVCSHDGVMGVAPGVCVPLAGVSSVYTGTKLPDLRQGKSGGKTGLAPWGCVCRVRAALPGHRCGGSACPCCASPLMDGGHLWRLAPQSLVWLPPHLLHVTVTFGDLVSSLSLSYAARRYRRGCFCPGCCGKVTGRKPAAKTEADARECRHRVTESCRGGSWPRVGSPPPSGQSG